MTVTPIWITWLNYLGGFEYFLCQARKEYSMEIEDTGIVTENLLPNWPNSFGQTADTVDKQTFRNSRQSILIRTQHLNIDQLNALQVIKTSPLVQIITSRGDRRTVIVDSDSFVQYDEKDKVFDLKFKIRFTNQNPSQKL